MCESVRVFLFTNTTYVRNILPNQGGGTDGDSDGSCDSTTEVWRGGGGGGGGRRGRGGGDDAADLVAQTLEVGIPGRYSRYPSCEMMHTHMVVCICRLAGRKPVVPETHGTGWLHGLLDVSNCWKVVLSLRGLLDGTPIGVRCERACHSHCFPGPPFDTPGTSRGELHSCVPCMIADLVERDRTKTDTCRV